MDNCKLEELNNLINKHYEMTYLKRYTKFKLSTGPSKSKNICERQIYFDIRNYEKEQSYTYQQINTFEIGSQLEKLITDRLKDFGFILSHILEEQQEFNFMPGLKGFADGIIENIENTFLYNFFNTNTRLLLEMKTAKDKNFQNLQRNKLKKAKIQHFAQMQSYLYAMSNMEEYKDIKYGLYVCLNKDNSNLYFEIIERDLEYGKENIEELKRIVYNSTLPPKTKIFCNWCNYKDICKKIDNFDLKDFRICNKCKFCIRDKESGNIICEKNSTNFNIESEEITNCELYSFPNIENKKMIVLDKRNKEREQEVTKNIKELRDFFNSL